MFGRKTKLALEREIEKNQELTRRLSETESQLEDIKNEPTFRLSLTIDDLRKKEAVLKLDLADLVNRIQNKNDEYEALKRDEEHAQAILKKYQGSKEDIRKRLEFADNLIEKIDAHKNEIINLERTISENKLYLDDINQEIIDAENKLENVEGVLETPALELPSEMVKSQSIKELIDENKNQQRYLIKNKKAWEISSNITFNDSLASGRARQRRLAKFLMVAFNAETDTAIRFSKAGAYHKSFRLIANWFNKINALGADNFITIKEEFLNLRLEELKLVTEYRLQQEFEKELDRYTAESIREENKVQKEVEKFVKAREAEEKDYREAIKKATKDLKKSADHEVEKLTRLIADLEEKLERSLNEKERAMSLAQLTRTGHVYVISNQRSFGPGIYKIGMTRRLDPMDRVKELGNASVPFFFDVHGIIHSDDAPGLERELHKRFDERRINKENYRREFFEVSIEEIESALAELCEEEVNLERTYEKGSEQ